MGNFFQKILLNGSNLFKGLTSAEHFSDDSSSTMGNLVDTPSIHIGNDLVTTNDLAKVSIFNNRGAHRVRLCSSSSSSGSDFMDKINEIMNQKNEEDKEVQNEPSEEVETPTESTSFKDSIDKIISQTTEPTTEPTPEPTPEPSTVLDSGFKGIIDTIINTPQPTQPESTVPTKDDNNDNDEFKETIYNITLNDNFNVSGTIFSGAKIETNIGKEYVEDIEDAETSDEYHKIYARIIQDDEVSVEEKFVLYSHLFSKYDYPQAELSAYKDLTMEIGGYNKTKHGSIEEYTKTIEKLTMHQLELVESIGGKSFKDATALMVQGDHYTAHIKMWSNIYKANNNNPEILSKLNDIMSMRKLAKYAATLCADGFMEFMGENNIMTASKTGLDIYSHTEVFNDLFNGTINHNLDYNNDSSAKSEHGGIEKKYSNVRDVLKAYENGKLDREEALYVLSCKYSSVSTMVNDFVNTPLFGTNMVTSGDYLKNLVSIMMYNPDES